jgi:hypothetical protein
MASRQGDWNCHCGYSNFKTRTKCLKCNDFKSKSARNVAGAGDWRCAKCTEFNSNKLHFKTRSTHCKECNEHRYGATSARAGSSTLQLLHDATSDARTVEWNEWLCEICKSYNQHEHLECHSCGFLRAPTVNSPNLPPLLPATSSSSAAVPAMELGDWLCDVCKSPDFNFKTRLTCRSCGEEKSKSTKSSESTNPILTECCICMERPIQFCVMACGHLCMCSVCCHAVDACPMCRTKIEPLGVRQIYFC